MILHGKVKIRKQMIRMSHLWSRFLCGYTCLYVFSLTLCPFFLFLLFLLPLSYLIETWEISQDILKEKQGNKAHRYVSFNLNTTLYGNFTSSLKQSRTQGGGLCMLSPLDQWNLWFPLSRGFLGSKDGQVLAPPPPPPDQSYVYIFK